jgi:hypothetical protein
MKRDFIIDFETLGKRTRTLVVVDCAYTTFDRNRFADNPYSFEELVDTIQKSKFDVKKQTELGFKFGNEDLDWWQSQPPEVQKNLRPCKEDLTYQEFSDTLKKYLDGVRVQKWWTRGNNFDPPILERIFDLSGELQWFDDSLKFWNARDVRTYVNGVLGFEVSSGFVPVSDETYWKDTFIAHDSRHDVAADIMRLQALIRLADDLELTER